MKFTAAITIMTRAEILDPQGKAVQLGLHNLNLNTIHDVRIGKHITLSVEADDETNAHNQVDAACRQLLANLIMEDYTFTLHQ